MARPGPINRLTAKGPELLFLLRTGRSNRPGTATRPRVQAKPEVSRRDAVISLLSWIFGSLTFFPQGLVPLIFLIVGARVKSWFLALYVPHAWSWVTVFVMISIGIVLYSQAIRITLRGSRNQRGALQESANPPKALFTTGTTTSELPAVVTVVPGRVPVEIGKGHVTAEERVPASRVAHLSRSSAAWVFRCQQALQCRPAVPRLANPLPSPREGIISPDRRRAAPAPPFRLDQLSYRAVDSTTALLAGRQRPRGAGPAPRAAPPPATCPPANGAASAPTPVPTAHDQRYAEAPPAQHPRPLVDEQGGTQAQPRALAPTSNPRLTRTAERFGARTHVGPRGWSRVRRRQNSLPSGSARTCQLSVPVWPMSAGLAPRASSRSSSASWSRWSRGVDVQSELPGPRVAAGAEDKGGLRAAEADVGRPDLSMLPSSSRPEYDVAEDAAPECGEPVGVHAIDDQLTDAARHARQHT